MPQYEPSGVVGANVSGSLGAEEELVKRDRQQVYGDPLENHAGIAQMWASILQPWADRIALGTPLPPHVIALLMTLLKINRMRYVFHEDNYVDASVYSGFARQWQPSAPTPNDPLPQVPGEWGYPSALPHPNVPITAPNLVSPGAAGPLSRGPASGGGVGEP